MEYTTLSFVAGFALGATVFHILCINEAQKHLKQQGLCLERGTLRHGPELISCPNTSSAS